MQICKQKWILIKNNKYTYVNKIFYASEYFNHLLNKVISRVKFIMKFFANFDL